MIPQKYFEFCNRITYIVVLRPLVLHDRLLFAFLNFWKFLLKISRLLDLTIGF